MNYLDIWIFDRRPRMKVFFCYLLIFVSFFIFSNIMIDNYTKAMYQPMTSYEINVTSPEVTIETAEATHVNGTIKGTIKNTTEEVIDKQYLKFEFYTPRNVNIGTQYIEVKNLFPEEQQKYELAFRYDNVSNVKVSLVEEENFL